MSDFSDFLAGKQLVVKDYSGLGDSLPVSFTEDGWLCATSLAMSVEKKFYEWERSKATRDYLDALIVRSSEVYQREFSDFDFIRVVRGAPSTGGGSWIHPKLVVRYATWINPSFGVWADEVIFDLLSGKTRIVHNDPSLSVSLTSFETSTESSLNYLIQKVEYLENLLISLVPPSSSTSKALPLVPIDSASSVCIKEVSDIREGWWAAMRYAERIGLSPSNYINLVFADQGYLVMTEDGWVTTPKAAGYLAVKTKSRGSRSKAKNTIIYHDLADHLLYGLNIIFSGRTPIITQLTEQEMTNIQGDRKFTQIKPTVTTILDKAVGGLVDVAKVNAETIKVNADNTTSLIEIVKRLTPETALSEGLLPIEDPPYDSTNVVPFSKSA